jgi:uncharacterized protein (DUF1697 family)
MVYIAFIRGINVGKKNWIPMGVLKSKFEECGYLNVQTYINSGNVIFESKEIKNNIRIEIEGILYKHFSDTVKTIILKRTELAKLSNEIPKAWLNDKNQRTDVALLFPEIDKESILEELPFKKEFINVRYAKGAIYWNVKRSNVVKSRLAKIIGQVIYPFMTIRNINTIRKLAE